MNGKSNNSLINNDSNKQIAKPIIPPPSANSTLSSQMETGDGNVALDLVVVIDTSGSMADESSDLSQQIDDAVQKALGRCPSSLRVTFLGIEGTWDNTKFDRSVTDYLMTQGVSAHKLQARAPFKEADGRDHAGNKEDLCRAVIDVCKYFDWRDGARRAIFVLGDEGMEGGGGVLTQAAVLKNNEAIVVARSEKVKVYTYQGTPNDDPSNVDRFPTIADRDNITKEYVRLAQMTGGRSYIYTTGIANFSLVLQEILCDSLTLPKLPDLNKDNSTCRHVCEELSTIISTVNTLAEIMHKAIDSCCKEDWGTREVFKPHCDC
ncbi:VWA domain-containing protein [Proteus mirabilis]|uniref:VWA domain-containing protein n=1 Tax=Proteus mirabilis TaxID=584 RepID=UPI0018C6AC23|nr:VWA domain-containing protein [Proteus mirabilis]MBG3073148.1 VWA domain-containing protein [Proteus mirabilis]MBI6226412.1 VWA domain-containing protein [Proteus mirabilis]MBI6468735.1 VWA domain-containing protein [Proteus mirabilis]HEI8888447.1 VWA domain-containing protein [Proteus mirabilis]